jgi:hypothetical protein
MPKVAVDSLEIEVPAGATVVQACGKLRPGMERRIMERGTMIKAAE